jgi:hypothetical protein
VININFSINRTGCHGKQIGKWAGITKWEMAYSYLQSKPYTRIDKNM